MKKNLNKHMQKSFVIFISFLPYIFVFIASLYRPTDPDLGWHLKYGEYFFQHHQILRDNIYSTMMPAYHWANGSWGTDIITYTLFKFGGFFGLTLVSAAVVTTTIFFFSQAANLTFLQETVFFPLLLFLETSINSSSFRGQQLSLLFLGILFFLLYRCKLFSKILLFIPLLFLIWCNVHEESFLGLALFGLWVSLTLLSNFFIHYQQNKNTFYKGGLFWILLFLSSFLVSFINPFGWNIHLVALSHLRDPLLKNISEYVPFPLFSLQWWSQICMLIFVLSGIIFLFYKKQPLRTLGVWGIPLVLLLSSFAVRRYAWPGYYLLLPLLPVVWYPLEKHLKKYSTNIAFVVSLISLLYILILKIPFTQFTTMSWDTYCTLQEVPCSPASAKYLQTHHLTQNLFSYYDWGGWLIWNYPDVKPSIDGRMHVWRDKNHYSATEDYAEYENGQKSIDKSTYNIVYLPNDGRPLVTELSELVQQNQWKVAYKDELAGVIVRIENK